MSNMNNNMEASNNLVIQELELAGLKLIHLKMFNDNRGFFVERFNKNIFKALNLPDSFEQINHSRSEPAVIRGMHYQENPAQGKLVGVISGRVLDVALDIRPDSATFGKYYSVELNENNGLLLWIPSGFAHGFCVLGDKHADLIYQVDAQYNPLGDRGIIWNDKDIAIKWPLELGVTPIISAKDAQLPTFAQVFNN